MAPSNRTIFIAMNTQRPPLDNVKVRQALNYAVDKQAIITNVLFGAGALMDAPGRSLMRSMLGFHSCSVPPNKRLQLTSQSLCRNLVELAR